MGNANCVVLNDKEANVQLTAFNYCNDTCSVPVWELTLKPGETKNVSAGLDMTGVTISELVDGNHAMDQEALKRQNFAVVKLSSIFTSSEQVFVRCANRRNGISFVPPGTLFCKGGEARMAVVWNCPQRQVSAQLSIISDAELLRSTSDDTSLEGYEFRRQLSRKLSASGLAVLAVGRFNAKPDASAVSCSSSRAASAASTRGGE